MSELKDKASEALKTAKTRATDAASVAREKASSAAATARAKAAQTRDAARETSARAIETTRETARTAAQKTKSGIDHNPLVAVLGGLAIGAIAAALLPRTEREDKAVGKIGKTVRDTASSALRNAKETGKEQLGALGVTSDAARDQVKGLVEKIASAASSAAEAASDSIRKR